MKAYITIIYILISLISSAQTFGGSAAYNFLRLPASPLLTAAGGINTSYSNNEVSMAANNPALLDATLTGQINSSFSKLPGEIKVFASTGAYQYDRLHTTFGGHIFFIDYGNIPQTDAAGNVSGEFHPVDYVIQVEGSRRYQEKWRYGGSLKFISSNYQLYKSSAIAADVSVLYIDSSSGISSSFLAKNMGFQLKTYIGETEDLPFDIQIGLTKRLKNSPFGFSVTAHHLHQFDLGYNDQAFNQQNNLSSNSSFGSKLFNHFVVASHIYIGNHIEGTVGYNQLRRSELNTGAIGNGLSGFSLGMFVKFQKLQVMYARTNYQKNIATNQFGFTLQLQKL